MEPLEPLDLRTALRTTGSVRAFTDEAVPLDVVARVLDTARFAPSGANMQGWRVIVVQDPTVRAQIDALANLGWREYAHMTAAGQRPFAADDTGHWPGPSIDLEQARRTPAPWSFMDGLATVPVLMVVCVDLRVVAAVDVEADRIHIAGGGSIYPFVWNLLLSARAEGLGGVMTTFLVRQEAAARDLLGLPPYVAIASLVAMGHPVHQPTKLSRKPVAEFATLDHYNGPAVFVTT